MMEPHECVLAVRDGRWVSLALEQAWVCHLGNAGLLALGVSK